MNRNLVDLGNWPRYPALARTDPYRWVLRLVFDIYKSLPPIGFDGEVPIRLEGSYCQMLVLYVELCFVRFGWVDVLFV